MLDIGMKAQTGADIYPQYIESLVLNKIVVQ